MIAIRRLNKKQKADLDEMLKMEGWKIVTQVIEGSIQISNVDLINWKFKYDDNGDITKKSVREYEQKQYEVGLLKKFLQFIHNPAIIKDVQE